MTDLRRGMHLWLCWALAMCALPVAGALWGNTFIGVTCVLLGMAGACGLFVYLVYRDLTREEKPDGL